MDLMAFKTASSGLPTKGLETESKKKAEAQQARPRGAHGVP